MIDWMERDKQQRKPVLKVPSSLRVEVGEDGHMTLPPEVLDYYGLDASGEIQIDLTSNSLRLRRSVTRLARVYIEPTDRCNLRCRTCIRNNWTEPLGRMSDATFSRIIAGLRAFPLPLTVFFGGFGEPLSHPHIIDMVTQAKRLGASVELISNGTMLTEKMSRRLMDAGLDVLWVSLDGATPESYEDVRLTEALPQIEENLARFHALRLNSGAKTELAIAFVAMRSNVGDLPALLKLGSRLGVTRYSVSGVLPHTSEMCDEVLYRRSLMEGGSGISMWAPQLSLPRMDFNEDTREALYQALRSGRNMSFGGANLSEGKNRCPFIEKGATAISWAGHVTPCLPLLHEHVSYLEGRERISHRHIVGNVNNTDLHSIWLSPEYVAFRRRVQGFEYSPCTFCGGCNLSEDNKEDCSGNVFPTCGGCLWAQGVIQCP